MVSSASSSKPAKFDPLRLLSEIQSESIASTPTHDDPHSPPADEDEDDFMSDRYLSTSESKQPLTYTDKRRKFEAHHSRKEKPKSLKQREEEAREEGLDRDLLAEAEIVAGGGRLPPEGRDGSRRWDLLEKTEGEEKVFVESGTGEDGTSKAMRMMLAMGYRRGEALGKRMQATEKQDEVEEEVEESDEEENASRSKERIATKAGGLASPPDDTDLDSLDTDEEAAARQEEADAQAREEDEYLTGGFTSSPFSSALTKQPFSDSKTTEPLRPDQRWLLNRRAGIGMIPKPSAAISAAIQSKASSSLLRQQQQIEAESDYRTRISREHAERHNQHLLSRARKTLIDLDRSSSHTRYSPLWLKSDLYYVLSGHKGHVLDQGTIDEKLQRDPAFKEDFELLQAAFGSEDTEVVREAKTFVELGTKEQLELVLERLRQEHKYCLFCGCQYKDEEDLAASCPGEEENDHD